MNPKSFLITLLLVIVTISACIGQPTPKPSGGGGGGGGGVIPSSDFTISLNPTGASIQQGQSTTTVVTIQGFSPETVSLSCSNFPEITCSFSPTFCTPTCSSTLTITTASTTAASVYAMTVSGRNSTDTRSATYSLTVNTPPPNITEITIDKQEILNGWDDARQKSGVLGSYGNSGLTALAVWNYWLLGEEVPNKTDVINYLNSQIGNNDTNPWGIFTSQLAADQKWPNLAIHLMAYNLLGTKPNKSLDVLFSTIDTWQEVHDEVVRVRINPWGNLWGYVYVWRAYYDNWPPWINNFFTDAEANKQTWLCSEVFCEHQRNHLWYVYTGYGRDFPNITDIIRLTAQVQASNGMWGSPTLLSETGGQLHMLAGLKLLGYDGDIENMMNKSISTIRKLYVKQIVDSKTVGTFKLDENSQPSFSNSVFGSLAGISAGIIVGGNYSTLDPLWLRWRV